MININMNILEDKANLKVSLNGICNQDLHNNLSGVFDTNDGRNEI